MKRLATKAAAVFAGAALLLAGAAEARPRLTGEQELARLLAGRAPGRPVSCIPASATRDVQVIDKTAIVYGWGGTIYVNRPYDARRLDSDDVLVTRSHTPELCSVDIVETRERSGLWYNGFVSLGEFVPYRRVASRD
jgi:hypothetical protein